MEIENKMLELRKQNDLSQEQLAEKMGVARQTISKWELGETSPDLEQAKRLSQIFNISLDDLTNNKIRDISITKVSSTKSLTKLIINILKIILMSVIILVVLAVSKIFFEEYFSVEATSLTLSFSCEIDDKKYSYRIYQNFESANNLQLYTNDNDLKIDSSKYDDYDWLMKDINKNVTSRGGKCFINDVD